QDQAALADRERFVVPQLDAMQVAAAEQVHVGVAEVAVAHAAQPAPGAGQRTGLAVEEIAAQPGGAALSLDGGPMPAAVGREKQARRILIGAVACEVARLGVAEADEVEAGNG